MGKKIRREREEKRDSFASQRTKEKRKNTLITVAVLSAIGAIVAVSAYNFTLLSESAPGAPPGAGILGSTHDHISILVKLHGDTFDFTSQAFQIKSSYIHFEARDGATIHKHATGVTMGYLFESMGIGLDDECYTFKGTNGDRVFCTNEDFSLKFYVNHEPVPNITDLVLVEGDRVLISYGGETQEQIDSQLTQLDALVIQA